MMMPVGVEREPEGGVALMDGLDCEWLKGQPGRRMDKSRGRVRIVVEDTEDE